MGEAGSSTGSPLRNDTGDPSGGDHGRTVTGPVRVPNENDILEGDNDGEGDSGRSRCEYVESRLLSSPMEPPPGERPSASGSKLAALDLRLDEEVLCFHSSIAPTLSSSRSTILLARPGGDPSEIGPPRPNASPFSRTTNRSTPSLRVS